MAVRVEWVPPEGAPPDAADLEQEIGAAVPTAEVRLRWDGQAWRVRALLPAAMCSRAGRGFESRDVSATVVEILEDAGHPARR